MARMTTTTTTTTTTTPNEFLQFAKDLGLDEMKTINDNTKNNSGCNQTGLFVLNNLCHLIEQIHRLKTENDRLRAHIELTNHVEKIFSKNDEKTFTISPSSSLKVKKHGSSSLSISSRERRGTELSNHPEDTSSIIQIESEMMGSNLGLSSTASPSWNHWSKVRHALKFSLRRKTEPPMLNPVNVIPSISISMESGDDEHVHENRETLMMMKKKRNIPTNINRRDLLGDESDHDDELMEFHPIDQKREFYRNYQMNSSSNDTNTQMTIDEDQPLARKQSKIAHYRRKIRSKLNTVKRQFSDQSSSSTSRHFSSTHTSIMEDFTGQNHAFLSAQLAPAMTKSYQQKMRQWQTIQKSHFLVNYRRQSLIPRIESNIDSGDTSITRTNNEISPDVPVPSLDQSLSEVKTDDVPLSPILSPHQRSLIVHQWREIMSEEIALRIYGEYLEKKLQEIKRLQTDLKSLKRRIFCTNNQDYLLKHRSMTSIDQLDQDFLEQHRQTSLPQRSLSYQSLICMPASWILAIQSATYSDILDGTSKKTTDRAIIFDKQFFHQLNHFKNDRTNFEEHMFQHCPIPSSSKTLRKNFYERNSSENQSMRTRSRTVLNRAYLRKFSFASPSELPTLIPMMPIQTLTSNVQSLSQIDIVNHPSESELNLPSSSSSILTKQRSKRSRFDLRKTLRRSKSMCLSQIHSWFHRRRRPSTQQQQQNENLVKPRRQSAFETKSKKESLPTPISSSSTSKLYGSPRLARLHRRIFKQQPGTAASAPATPTSELLPPLPCSYLDDSDQNFVRQELPVRIYLPAQSSPTTRHVRINDNAIKTPSLSKITSPIINRRTFLSAIKKPTARQRRESYAASTSSNVLNT